MCEDVLEAVGQLILVDMSQSMLHVAVHDELSQTKYLQAKYGLTSLHRWNAFPNRDFFLSFVVKVLIGFRTKL